MRILHVLSHSSIRGGQVVVSSLLRATAGRSSGVSFGVVLPGHGPYVDRFRSEGIETYILPVDTPFLRPSSLRKHIHDFFPDIIHTHERRAWFHVRRALEPGKGPTIIHSFHGYAPSHNPLARRIFRLIDNRLASATDAFVCVSESEANEAFRWIPGVRGKIQVIQNCIDSDLIVKESSNPLPDMLRNWLDSHTGKKVITMVARAVPIKNHDLACAAAEDVLTRRSQYVFLFVGIPPSDARIKRLQKLFGNAVMAVASLPSAAPVICRSWILLLTSHREGLPLVVQEGFALGVPTIGTKVPGILDVVQDGWNGFLMDAFPDGLFAVLERLEHTPDLYASVVRGAQEQASYLRIRSWARDYHDFYRKKVRGVQGQP